MNLQPSIAKTASRQKMPACGFASSGNRLERRTSARVWWGQRGKVASGQTIYAYVEGDPISMMDPTGEFANFVIGSVVGFGFDLVNQLARNGGDWRCIDVGQLLTSTALGFVGGGISGRGLLSLVKGLSRPTKGKLGEALSVLENRLAGSRLVSTQSRIPGQRTIADSTWRSRSGSTYYVESKFGKAQLTSAQRAAQKTLGDSYQVERWSYSFFNRVGAYPGGAAGALLVDQFLSSDCSCQ